MDKVEPTVYKVYIKKPGTDLKFNVVLNEQEFKMWCDGQTIAARFPNGKLYIVNKKDHGTEYTPVWGPKSAVMSSEALRKFVDSHGAPVNEAPSGLVISLPPEVEQYRHDIRRFVEAMVYKLSVHASKGKWENYDLGTALDKMAGEVKELKEAAQRGNMVEIMLESADVANYALIASAIAMERGK